jgi:hypothetical protein
MFEVTNRRREPQFFECLMRTCTCAGGAGAMPPTVRLSPRELTRSRALARARNFRTPGSTRQRDVPRAPQKRFLGRYS